MADRTVSQGKVGDRTGMARAQWGCGNWGSERSPHEELGGTEAEDRTAEAVVVTPLGSKAALHKTNAKQRESSEGSEGLPLSMEQEPSNPRTEAKGAFLRASSRSWPAQPKPPPTFNDQLPEMGSQPGPICQHGNRSRHQHAEARCQPTVHGETYFLSDPRLPRQGGHSP